MKPGKRALSRGGDGERCRRRNVDPELIVVSADVVAFQVSILEGWHSEEDETESLKKQTSEKMEQFATNRLRLPIRQLWH